MVSHCVPLNYYNILLWLSHILGIRIILCITQVK